MATAEMRPSSNEICFFVGVRLKRERTLRGHFAKFIFDLMDIYAMHLIYIVVVLGISFKFEFEFEL